jgi:hypothetical protein
MTDLITEFAIRSSPAIWESGLCIGVFGIRCDLANHSDVPRPSETNADKQNGVSNLCIHTAL